MRSKEKTLFFTFLARRASPAIQKKKLHKCRIQMNICEYLKDAIVNKNSVTFHWNSEQQESELIKLLPHPKSATTRDEL